ncbi:hypothetical protein Barb7_02080 [Bacteroidales bacterium Barb7]|nr:hypothetical protein Barb7_02080 [Bacteroidales bacterium Barb7]
MAEAKRLMPIILKWEGGYVNNPSDRGGETNKGITLAAWQAFGHNVSEKLASVTEGKKTWCNVTKSLYEMTGEQWLEIFKNGYWNRWKADRIIDQSVANILVDWVWSSGIHGIKIPQKLLGLPADGTVGEKTLEAVNASEPSAIFAGIKEARLEFVKALSASNPSQACFLSGWKNRINDFNYIP